MLSLGEVHNMGLNGRGGFRPGGDHALYGRSFSSYGYSSPLDGVAGNVGLQQHLNDFIHQNSFLQTSLPQTDPVTSMGFTGAYHNAGLTSMGFSQSELDRSLLFDVEALPHVADHENLPFSIPVTSSVAAFPGVGLGSSSISVLLPQPATRERWVEATVAASPRGVKRDGGVQDQINMQPRKKFEKSGLKCAVEAKVKRPSEQADHILRERQRRDDMTSKFAVLESLLPIGVKRDRSTIVDDSIEYVKNLHHRIKSLQERKVQLEKASATADGTSNETRRKGPATEALHSPSPKKFKETTRPLVSQEEVSRIRAVLKSCLESMQVHADLPHQVVIEMVCRPQPRLQSNILQCLESLNLDVMQCSITKISHRIICAITAKPQEVTTPTSGIVAALKYALGSDVQSS